MRARLAALPAVAVLALTGALIIPASASHAEASRTSDSDHDGMPDRWEVRHHLNPHDRRDAKRDADRDGVSNLREYRAHGNPRDKDTDNDGVDDRTELRLHTKLNRTDSDHDGISDGNDDANHDGICDRDHRNAKGVVVSFDATTGTLVVKTRRGTLVSLTVTNDTEIRQRHHRGWAHHPEPGEVEGDAVSATSEEPADGTTDGTTDDTTGGTTDGTTDDGTDDSKAVTIDTAALLKPGAVLLQVKLVKGTHVVEKIKIA